MTFRVGMEVECVNGNGTWVSDKGIDPGPDKGDVLRVARVGEVCGWVYLRFAKWGDYKFLASCFRPVQKRKTDISSLVALLKTKSEKELV